MKLSSILAAILLSISFAAIARQPTVRVLTLDSGEVIVGSNRTSIDVLAMGGPLILWNARVEHGRVPRIDMEILLKSDRWRYLQCNDTRWLVDGEIVQLTPFYYDEVRMTNKVLERWQGSLTPDQLAGFLRSKSIELRICKDAYRFTPDQVAHMVDFGTKLAEQLSKK